ncbi:MAG: pilus assembly protein PilP [Desulfobulbaceae bacterium]|nr:MAG: pilus assembly protein PilP [Desulfobulbaceae bacterium]
MGFCMKTNQSLSLSLTRSSFLLCFSISMILSFFCFPSAPAQAAEPQQPAPQATSGEESKSESVPFEYIQTNRPDPFLPFISEKATARETGDPNEIIEKNEPLTGMQLFEPGQLSLVGLLETGGEKFAMVQDSTGKGYVIVTGTKIGRRGVVKTISPNKVLIEETAETRGGKKILTYIDMVLKKEGEE